MTSPTPSEEREHDARPAGVAGTVWEDRDGLVERLEIRAAFAREEETATATVDALYFEEAAAEITRLRAEVERKDEALKPFAMSERGLEITIGDLRRARAARRPAE